MTTTLDNTAKIRELNDAFRRDWPANGRIATLPRMSGLGVALLAIMIACEVQRFDAFTEDNDPHGEHDFGSIEHKGERIFWKIDYYDRACEFGSEDPADPTKTTRVLTIMLAEEY